MGMVILDNPFGSSNSYILLLFVAGSVLWAFVWHRRKSQENQESCIVSKAHLTCDPGDFLAGYNSIVATISFETRLDPECFFDQFVRTLVSCGPESMWQHRMIFAGGHMHWQKVDATKWNPRDHLQVHSQPLPEQELESIVSRLITSPVRLDRPCWDITFFERVCSDDRVYSVCILKYHHAMADGFTMLRHMLLRSRPVDQLNERNSGLDVLPSMTRMQTQAPPYSFGSVIKSLVGVLTQKPDRPSIFRASSCRKPQEPLLVAFSDLPTITVDKLKMIKNAFRKRFGIPFSLNDILVSALTIAMRNFARLESGESHIQDANSVIWVSLPRSEKSNSRELGNGGLGFALCALPLSMNTSNISETVIETQRRLAALKASPEPAIINIALYLIGLLPVWLGKRISALAADKASCSISNMAGPTHKLVWPVPRPEERTADTSDHGCGVVKSVFFATSPPFHYGPLFSLLTYHGNVYVSVSGRAEIFTKDELSKLVKFYLLNAVIEIEKSL